MAMNPDVLAQIAGGGNAPSQVPLAQAAPVAPAAPQAPQSPAVAAAVDPREAMMQEAMAAADELFKQQTGQSYIALVQSGQVDPEMEKLFTSLVEQVITGDTTGQQQMAMTRPSSIL